MFGGVHSDMRDLVCGRDGQGRQRRGHGDKSDGEIISNGMDHRTGRKTADVDKLASKTRTRFHEQMRFLVDGTFRCSFRRTRGSMEHALKAHLFHRTGSYIMLWWWCPQHAPSVVNVLKRQLEEHEHVVATDKELPVWS